MLQRKIKLVTVVIPDHGGTLMMLPSSQNTPSWHHSQPSQCDHQDPSNQWCRSNDHRHGDLIRHPTPDHTHSNPMDQYDHCCGTWAHHGIRSRTIGDHATLSPNTRRACSVSHAPLANRIRLNNYRFGKLWDFSVGTVGGVPVF